MTMLRAETGQATEYGSRMAELVERDPDLARVLHTLGADAATAFFRYERQPGDKVPTRSQLDENRAAVDAGTAVVSVTVLRQIVGELSEEVL